MADEWWIDEDGEYLCICEGEANEFGEREEVAMLHTNRPSLKASQYENARLIAAAPGLLKAASELLNNIGKFGLVDESGSALEVIHDGIVALSRAIDRAEGRKK
jgi:hypothetical protein